MNERSAQLRALLERPGIVVLPGAYDCLSARLAEQAGFETVFTTGFGFAASALGVPDLGLMTASEILDRVHNIVQSVQVPLVADMDTGYGNPLNVIRTVSECVGMGVAGIILEDQEWPKKCGHLEGKRVIPMEDHVQKLRAAVDARGDSGLVIIARTDARAVLGMDDALERGQAYYEAGADVVFIEAPQSLDELHANRQSLPDSAALCQHDRGRQDTRALARCPRRDWLQDRSLSAFKSLFRGACHAARVQGAQRARHD